MPTIPGLYDIFSANLSLYKEDYNGHFMCPLCLHTFFRDEIHSDLSKAHIIPQFQGGKDWTLTCKKCNNKLGSEIESYESKRIKYHRALSGNSDETITAHRLGY